MKKASLVLALTIVALGCDPPCKPYWEARCKSCGQGSPGCEHARFAGEHELSDPGKCEKLTKLEHDSTDLARGRYCELHKTDPRSLAELKGPWICSGLRVDFRGPDGESTSTSSPQQMIVNDRPTRIWNLQHASFQIEGSPACTYWLGPHENSGSESGLSLLCPEKIGDLPNDQLVHCLREAGP